MTATVDYKTTLDLRRALTDDPPRMRQPVKINCPYHDDSIASAAVYPDGFHCHACGANVGPLQFLATLHGLDLATETAAVHAIADKLAALGPAEERATPQPVHESLAAKVAEYANWHLRLTLNYDPTAHYFKGRGFTERTVRDANLGHTGRAYVLPLYDRQGALFSVKYRRDDALDPHAPKYWTHPGTGRTAVYYPPLRDWQAFSGPVVLCEGELDALLLAQHGVPAVSVNNGVNAIPAVLPDIGGVPLVLCLDNDAPGIGMAEALVSEDVTRQTIRVAWRNDWGKDVTEAFQAGHGEALLSALRAAYRIVVGKQRSC